MGVEGEKQLEARQDGESSPCPSPSNGLDIRSSIVYKATMHRTIASRSMMLVKSLARSTTPVFARPSSLRLLSPSRSVSSSPSLRSSPEDDKALAPTPTAASTKDAPGEHEPELESVSLPLSVDPIPPQTPATDAVGSPSTNDVLEEIGSTTCLLKPEVASPDTTPLTPQALCPLASKRLIVSRSDFRRLSPEQTSPLHRFAVSPPLSGYEIVDPQEGDVVPSINYFGLWPDFDGRPLARDIISALIPTETPLPSHLEAKDPFSAQLNSPVLPSVPILKRTLTWINGSTHPTHPHVTILHAKVLTPDLAPDHPYNLIWEHFSFLALQPSSPEYLVRFGELVWDGDVMILTVDSIELVTTPEMSEEYIELWTLPPTVDKRFHLTVLRNPSVEFSAPAELLRRHRAMEAVRSGSSVLGKEAQRAMKGWAKVNSVDLLGGDVEGGPFEMRGKFAARELDAPASSTA